MGIDIYDTSGLVRAARRQASLTQRELADMADVHWRTIQDIESGRFRGRWPTMIRVLRACGYRVSISKH